MYRFLDLMVAACFFSMLVFLGIAAGVHYLVAPLSAGPWLVAAIGGLLAPIGYWCVRVYRRKTAGSAPPAGISITLADSCTAANQAYSVYVDGWLAGTRPGAPGSSDLIEIPTGTHRLVVRERNARKARRQESNTLQFSAAPGAKLAFTVARGGDTLELAQVD